jgi:hypothetical protein
LATGALPQVPSVLQAESAHSVLDAGQSLAARHSTHWLLSASPAQYGVAPVQSISPWFWPSALHIWSFVALKQLAASALQ